VAVGVVPAITEAIPSIVERILQLISCSCTGYAVLVTVGIARAISEAIYLIVERILQLGKKFMFWECCSCKR
jgi:hypothetical protein